MRKKIWMVCCGVLSASLLLGSSAAKGFSVKKNILEKNTEIEKNVEELKNWKDASGEVQFPVTAESEEWETFETHDEMIEACNVPESLLKEMTTEELVELMLTYPMLGDLRMYDDLNLGFQCLAQNSNVLTEILNREDGAQALLEAYKSVELIEENAATKEFVENASENGLAVLEEEKYEEIVEEISDSMIEDTFLEVALGQEEVFEELTVSEIEELAETANEIVTEKKKSDIYAADATIIYEVAEQNDCLKELDSSVELEEVVSEETVKGNAYTTTVKTPKGSKVSVIAYDFYGFDAAIADTNYVKKYYPKATIVSGATNLYNCHSYAWYKQSASNRYWMNNPCKYMTDGSYKKVGTTPTAKGQKACYTSYAMVNPFIHSGVVYSISGSTVKLKSKWGSCPLVIHDVKYSPYAGTPIYYK